MPIAFLRQLIGFYGDSVQALLPSYLESSLQSFTRNQGQLREQMARAFKGDALVAIEEQTRRNMEMFSEAMRMWMPLTGGNPAGPGSPAATGNSSAAPRDRKPPGRDDEIEALRRQLGEMQKTIETIAKRD
jgi:polyhydroxyalkanoate synthesis regulator protein